MPLHRICRDRARHPPRLAGAAPRQPRRLGLRATKPWAGRIAACRTGCRHGFGVDRSRDREPHEPGARRSRLGTWRENAEYRNPPVLRDRATATGGVGFPGRRRARCPCMPGATLTGSHGDRWQGQITVKLGPITAAFNGEARVIRDEARQRGMILGAGRDRLSASRANAEIEYVLTAEQAGTAVRVDITVRAALARTLGAVRTKCDRQRSCRPPMRHVCAQSRAAVGGIVGRDG